MSDQNQEVATAEQETEADKSELMPPEAFADSTEAEAPPAESEQDSAQDSSASPADAPQDEEKSFSIHTLKVSQLLSGTVKNITSFGAFVDIGLAQDGLVHISELAKHKVEKVSDVVSVGEEVEVWVKKVDRKRGRISLTMIKPLARRLRDISEGEELEGTITRLESYGAFVDIGSERDGLVHISQITHEYIKHPEDELSVGDEIKVKVLKVNRKKRQIDLSIKALLPPPAAEKAPEKPAAAVQEAAQEAVEEEPTPTAMALALAAMQEKGEEDEEEAQQDSYTEQKRKQKRELDDIIARTLATGD
jgi:ribosomal protein S1